MKLKFLLTNTKEILICPYFTISLVVPCVRQTSHRVIEDELLVPIGVLFMDEFAVIFFFANFFINNCGLWHIDKRRVRIGDDLNAAAMVFCVIVVWPIFNNGGGVAADVIGVSGKDFTWDVLCNLCLVVGEVWKKKKMIEIGI